MLSDLAERRRLIEAELSAALDRVGGDAPPVVAAAMAYSLLAPGKRLRPLLVVLGCEAAGGMSKEGLCAAAAVEMVHAYSLIHDDLPAMDDDDLRRGLPTCHVKFGEDVAILAGDALFAEAIKLITTRQAGEPQHVLDAVAELTAAAGVGGMVGGQYVDVTAAGDLDQAGLRRLHELKTGRLIGASVVCVLMLSGLDGPATIPYRRFAAELGVLFQIVDDILDVTGD